MEAIAAVRPDVRRVDENVNQSAKNILIEKGILRDPTKPTVLLDQFTGTKPLPDPEKDAAKKAEVVTKVAADTQTEL